MKELKPPKKGEPTVGEMKYYSTKESRMGKRGTSDGFMPRSHYFKKTIEEQEKKDRTPTEPKAETNLD